MRIDELALLSDCRTAAMVDRDGRVLWFSPGRFDAPSVFGALLDADAGQWTIRPRNDAETSRRYVGDGPILETTFRTSGGEVRLTDALALATGATGHEIVGPEATQLVRRAECVAGEMELEVTLAARPEYALTRPHHVATDDGWELSGGRVDLRLSGTHRLDDLGDALSATIRLRAGDRAAWTLTAGEADGRSVAGALDDTARGWASWAEPHDGVPGPYAAMVRRSSMVLQALTYAPTGVVIAAPTTSLPERIGGRWNFDYRYAWLRDLAFVVRALWVAACPDEPQRYFEWIARALGRVDGTHVPIMFGVEGERDLTERELDHFAGFRESRPVRVGNDAWQQDQLDVLGEVLDSAHLMRDSLGDPIATPIRETLTSLADRAASSWRDPDFGMWEARDRRRHYLSSKVMCWVALDRATRLAAPLAATERAAAWRRARDDVRRAVLEEGWNADVGAYTGAIGSDELDASVLLMPLIGMVTGDHPRMVATVRRIEERLASEHGVQRWADEGSGFVLCGFWLAECLALAGDRRGAEDRFAATAASASDLGLLSEEVDIASGEPLGNTPQALSHVGLINAAWRLTDTAEKGHDS